jgi:hypothetical protein
MILPPNAHTFEEYARIIHMVSLLPDDEARKNAADSPCNGVLKTMHQICQPDLAFPVKQKKSIYAPDFIFTAKDLMALWVKAQRCTIASRHLTHSYTFLPMEKIEVEHAKQRVKRNQPRTGALSFTPSVSNGEGGGYGVLFRGNHRSTRRRILQESKLVDQLIEWAV